MAAPKHFKGLEVVKQSHLSSSLLNLAIGLGDECPYWNSKRLVSQAIRRESEKQNVRYEAEG